MPGCGVLLGADARTGVVSPALALVVVRRAAVRRRWRARPRLRLSCAWSSGVQVFPGESVLLSAGRRDAAAVGRSTAESVAGDRDRGLRGVPVPSFAGAGGRAVSRSFPPASVPLSAGAGSGLGSPYMLHRAPIIAVAGPFTGVWTLRRCCRPHSGFCGPVSRRSGPVVLVPGDGEFLRRARGPAPAASPQFDAVGRRGWRALASSGWSPVAWFRIRYCGPR